MSGGHITTVAELEEAKRLIVLLGEMKRRKKNAASRNVVSVTVGGICDDEAAEYIVPFLVAYYDGKIAHLRKVILNMYDVADQP